MVVVVVAVVVVLAGEHTTKVVSADIIHDAIMDTSNREYTKFYC